MLTERTRYFFGAVFYYFSFLYFGNVFNKTIISLSLVEYEMINITNSALRASLPVYHLISNACSWKSCDQLLNYSQQ